MNNPFRVQHPGHQIYAAFAACAATRQADERAEVWRAREAQAVLQAASAVASEHGLAAPGLDVVNEAQIQAMGHSDYGVTWVCEVLKRMSARKGTEHVR